MGLFSVSARSPLETLLRMAGLLLVAGAVGLGFWWNGQRMLPRLEAGLALRDDAGALDAEQAAQVLGFAARLRRDYGLELRVHVDRTLPEAPSGGSAGDGGALFIGLGLEEKKALVRLPPLAARALGPDFARRLEQEHFPFHFAQGRSWQRGLLLALELMENRLAAATAATAQHKEAK